MNKMINLLFRFTNKTSYYGLIILHFFTVYMTFKMYGFGWSILSFCLPVISNIYIAIKVHAQTGFENYFVIFTVVFISMNLISWILAFLHKPETEDVSN